MTEKEEAVSRLRSLIVDTVGSDVDEQLFQALEGRVVFEKGTGRVCPRPGLFELPGKKRILILLLARRTAIRLAMAGAVAEAGSDALAKESQVPIKSCREYLSRLKAEGFIERSGDGYTLPEWNTLRGAEELLKNQGGV